MTTERFSAYVDDSTIELPLGRLAPRFLGALDTYLDELLRDFPKEWETVAQRLAALLRKERPGDAPSEGRPIRPDGVDAWHHEDRFPKLYVAHGELLCALLGVDQKTFLNAEVTTISQRRFIRARYVPRYLMLLALSESVSRDEAIDWMRRHLDDAIGRLPAREDAPDTLEELRTLQVEFNLAEGGMDWIQQVIGPHQYVNKVTRCRVHEVLSTYDPELMDVVACYPDFAMFRHTNPHFALTRTCTLMNGGSCCDTCYHDDRYVKPFNHPTELIRQLS